MSHQADLLDVGRPEYQREPVATSGGRHEPRAGRQESPVTPFYISQLETGLRKNPSVPVLRRLAKVFGARREWLE